MNRAWFWIGLLLGTANTARHRLRGYRTPRRFGPDETRRSVAYVLGVVDQWMSRGGIDVRSARVLELGPGPDLGTGAVLLARGASSYLAVDRFDLARSAPTEFYEALGNALGRPVDPDAVQFRTAAFPDLPEISGEFDLILSNAALEHFEDVPRTFRRLRELAAPGCVMYHHVDAKTHMRWVRDRDPLNILRFADSVYRRLLQFPGAPNRLLASDYLAAVERAGFSARILPVQRAAADYIRSVKPRLAAPHRERPDSDLELLSFALVTDPLVLAA